MVESGKPGLLTKLANDYRSTRTYVQATAQAHRTASAKQTAEHELATAYHQAGAKAWESDGQLKLDLPESGPVRDAQQALNQAEATLVEKQLAVAAAREKLASQTTQHSAIIKALEDEHRPLAEAAAGAAKELAAAQHGLAEVQGQIGKVQAEQARVGPAVVDLADLGGLEQRLGQLNESKAAATARVGTATANHKLATEAAKAIAAQIKSLTKTFQAFQAQCRSELKAAQAPPTVNEAAVKAINDKLAAGLKDNNQKLAVLQGQEQKLTDAVGVADAELAAAHRQVADIEGQIGHVNDQIAALKLEEKLAGLEPAHQAADAKVAEEKAKFEQAAGVAAAKAGELEKARQEWQQVQQKCQADISAAEAEQGQAQRAVESTRGPLAEALWALGRAVVQAGLPQPVLAESIAQARSILGRVAGLDAELTELKSRAEAAKGGTKRFAITVAAAVLVLVAVIVITWLVVSHVARSGKHAGSYQVGPEFGSRLAQMTTPNANTNALSVNSMRQT